MEDLTARWFHAPADWSADTSNFYGTMGIPFTPVAADDLEEEWQVVGHRTPEEPKTPHRTEDGALTEAGIADIIANSSKQVELYFGKNPYQFTGNGDFVVVNINMAETVVCEAWLRHYLLPKFLRSQTLACSCGEPHLIQNGQTPRAIYKKLPCSHGPSCWAQTCNWAHFKPIEKHNPLEQMTRDLTNN